MNSELINYKFLHQIFINSQILSIVLTLPHFDTECELYVLLWNVKSALKFCYHTHYSQWAELA